MEELYQYIQHHGMLAGRAWWVTADSVLYIDMKALLGRHQHADSVLTWGDVVSALSNHQPSPVRDRAIELADFMVRRESEEQRRA